MDTNLRVILQQLEAEKSIDRETLIEAIRSAIESAARKSMTDVADIVVEVDEQTLGFKVYEIRKVVEKVTDPTAEIELEAARKLNPNAEPGVRLKLETQPRDFGRIAASTAKQVIIQRIKDAERDNIYDEFKNREGELVTGLVKRHSHGNVIVTVDKAEAIIPPREQAGRESLRPGDRIRALLVQVEKTPRGAQLVLTRSSPDLVRALFEMEVPEIYDGTVTIKSIAREAGSRTKVAVLSNDANVDAVGACVGMKGSRVRTVVEELSGEKIDIVHWSDDPVQLTRNALNPADILEITLDKENKTIRVTVPHDQLSLAIGKRGQNARLASRLIGWTIDIGSETGSLAVATPDSAEVVELPESESAAEADEASAEPEEGAESAGRKNGSGPPVATEDSESAVQEQEDEPANPAEPESELAVRSQSEREGQ